MNWLDGVFALFLALLGFCGLCSGAAYALSCLVAGLLGGFLIQKASLHTSGLMAAVLSGVALLAGILGWMMRRIFMGPINRILGAAFGVLIGGLLLGVLWQQPFVERWGLKAAPARTSRTLPYLKKLWTWYAEESKEVRKVSGSLEKTLPVP